MAESTKGTQETQEQDPEWWPAFQAKQRTELDQCANCRFYIWFNEARDAEAECKRYAPSPRLDKQDLHRIETYAPYWPIVQSFDWCGDHQRHPKYELDRSQS